MSKECMSETEKAIVRRYLERRVAEAKFWKDRPGLGMIEQLAREQRYAHVFAELDYFNNSGQ